MTVARSRDGRRVLRLGRNHDAPAALCPEKHWKKSWDGWWRLLVYDVPENERAFRNGLRKFLYRLRMGYLQHSVWISPWDIRPDYADLQTTMDIHTVSVLFEARTVLGRKSSDLVLQAWDFEHLSDVQRAYIATSEAHLKELQSRPITRARVEALARQEIIDYLHAMEFDPLLPRKLLPADYHGFAAYEQHSLVVQQVRRHLGL